MSEKSFNCSQCNMPIYPPQVPGRQEFKDKFDQINCLGCGHINNYFQSRKIVQSEEKVKPKWRITILGFDPAIIIGVCLFVALLERLSRVSGTLTLVVFFVGLTVSVFYFNFKNFYKKN